MSDQRILETRDAVEKGYVSSFYQCACTCGRIGGDPMQTIAQGQTDTLQIKSIRFDDENTPMVDMENNRIMLVNSQKVYSVSVNVQVQVSESGSPQNTLALMWYDGTSAKEISAIDIMSKEGSTTQNFQLATLVKSNDQKTDDKNNNYIYVTLRNKGGATLSVSRFRFSAIRCV